MKSKITPSVEKQGHEYVVELTAWEYLKNITVNGEKSFCTTWLTSTGRTQNEAITKTINKLKTVIKKLEEKKTNGRNRQSKYGQQHLIFKTLNETN